jgi:exo-beta-1,3-glucanase (GH17 family)
MSRPAPDGRGRPFSRRVRSQTAVAFAVALLAAATPAEAAAPSPALDCVAFSPYVAGYNPTTGPHPSPAVIAQLLDRLVQQNSTKCIMTYGVLNGLEATFPAAQARGLTVIAIIWLDADPVVNDQSVAAGIAAALAYPETIARLSCGSEVRTRHGTSLDGAIDSCIERLRGAGVVQPITSIDTWWQWCNAAWPCQPRALAAAVDWIGVNVFPWWENRFSGIFTCTAASGAADFHVARLQNVMDRYPATPVVLTEFGWPSGPDGYAETNQYTGERCGVASRGNQALVVKSTLAKLRERQWSGVVFEAFKEPWKTAEGVVGPFWGLCGDAPAFRCVPGSLSAKTDLVVDFGPPFGLWLWIDNARWRPLHSTSADRVVAAHLDGDLRPDLIVNFAGQAGMWTMMNGSEWVPFHPFHAKTVLAADLDASGQDDIVADFGAPFGIWTYVNNATWQALHGLSARHVVAADVDGTGQDDLIVDFGPSFGVWVRRNAAAWTPLHGLSAARMVQADLDGNGRSDVVVDFGPPHGLWTWLNDQDWVPLHGFSPIAVGAGDLDAAGRDVLVADFGPPHGIWMYRHGSGWTALHGLSAARFVVGDLDGTGRADVAIDFGPAFGLWTWSNGGTWTPLHGLTSRGLHAVEVER